MAGANRSADVFLPASGKGAGTGAAPKGPVSGPGAPGQIFGMDRKVVIVVVIVGAIAAYLLYRHFHNAASTVTPTTDQTTPDTGTAGAGGPPPGGSGSGNVTPDPGSGGISGIDLSGISAQLDAITKEVGQIGAPSTSGQTVPGNLNLSFTIVPAPGGPNSTPTVTPPVEQPSINIPVPAQFAATAPPAAKQAGVKAGGVATSIFDALGDFGGGGGGASAPAPAGAAPAAALAAASVGNVASDILHGFDLAPAAPAAPVEPPKTAAAQHPALTIQQTHNIVNASHPKTHT